MKEIKSMPVDSNTCVMYRGRHREISFEISAHSFKDDLNWSSLPSVSWATYILLSEAQHELFTARIEDAPWNGGQTYYRKITEEHIDVSPELAEKWNRHYYKIGDDFMHFWDMERFDLYSREYLERHIKKVIDYLYDGDPE